ncbi:MAG: hypothetical protein HY696_06620 [Deltaproteobacteria bacterium]|nr:hypothetical protein [Deltaproteobacteria bacterium]
MRRLFMLAVMSGLWLGAVSATHADSNYIHTNRRLDYVKLEALDAKDQAALQPTHPAVVAVDKMREMLTSLQMTRRSLIKNKLTDLRIFDDTAVDYLSAYLAEGLRRATPQQAVYFSYLHGDPKRVFGNDRFSTGRVWMQGTELHVEFQKLFAKVVGDLDKRGYADKALARAKSLRITLQAGPGQVLGASNAAEVILDTKATYVASGNEQHRQPESMTERLEEIEKLYKRKLLNESEYRAKRQAVLNGL